jgi:hypothetical protein
MESTPSTHTFGGYGDVSTLLRITNLRDSVVKCESHRRRGKDDELSILVDAPELAQVPNLRLSSSGPAQPPNNGRPLARVLSSKDLECVVD